MGVPKMRGFILGGGGSFICLLFLLCKLVLKANGQTDIHMPTRRGVRVVEGARLESVYARKCIEGSNPSLSASDILVL